jgi:hypothetical protein
MNTYADVDLLREGADRIMRLGLFAWDDNPAPEDEPTYVRQLRLRDDDPIRAHLAVDRCPGCGQAHDKVTALKGEEKRTWIFTCPSARAICQLSPDGFSRVGGPTPEPREWPELHPAKTTPEPDGRLMEMLHARVDMLEATIHDLQHLRGDYVGERKARLVECESNLRNELAFLRNALGEGSDDRP